MPIITASDRELLESIYRMQRINGEKITVILRRLSALKAASKRGKSGLHEKRKVRKK